MIFFHGANSAGVELKPFVEAMRPYTTVRTPDLLAHGGRPIPQRMAMREIADDVVAYMDREGIEREILGGYSFGGTVALYVARHHPKRVRAVVALAAKHVFDAKTLKHWTHLVTPERLARLTFPWGKRTDELAKVHAPNTWESVAQANSRLFGALAEAPPLPEADLRAITVPVIVVSSNLDQIVPWEETLQLGRLIPDVHVAMFYGPAHPLGAIPLPSITRTIADWLRARKLVEA